MQGIVCLLLGKLNKQKKIKTKRNLGSQMSKDWPWNGTASGSQDDPPTMKDPSWTCHRSIWQGEAGQLGNTCSYLVKPIAHLSTEGQ